MKIIKTIKEMQEYSCGHRKNGKIIGVVPTMGFLHEGHLSLVDKAKEKCDIVIVTIFVNPMQFAPNEDLDKYPRDFEQDKTLCESRNVNAIFYPDVDEMYPEKLTTWINETSLTQFLCGSSRPAHFQGVTTVVTKLFNATLPDIAIFGQKDAQQALVLQKMTKDLNFPIEIIIAPIVRDKDGLAMSSRNEYLSCEERKNALSISKSLNKAKKVIELKEEVYSKNIIKGIKSEIENAGGIVDYIEIRDTKTLSEIKIINSSILIAVASYFGKIRLIDNIICK